jgi:hypothetical protein
MFCQKFIAISRHISPGSLLGVPTGICERALMDESEVIRTQMGRTVEQKVVVVHGTISS